MALKGAVSPNLVLLKNPMNVSVLIGNQLVVA